MSKEFGEQAGSMVVEAVDRLVFEVKEKIGLDISAIAGMELLTLAAQIVIAPSFHTVNLVHGMKDGKKLFLSWNSR